MSNEFVLKQDGMQLRIALYKDGVIRVTYFVDEQTDADKESLIVVGKPQSVKAENYENDTCYIIKTDFVKILVEKASLNITFADTYGQKISAVCAPVFEKYDIYRAIGGDTQIRKTVDGIKSSRHGGEKQYMRSSNHAVLKFDLEEELLFGLGSHEEGYPCINGQFVPLYQENMRIALPYFVSTKNYAYLVDNASWMTFDCRKEQEASLYIDTADSVDYYFIAGKDYDEICKEYSYLTGTTTMLPKWTVGYAQSREHYKTQQELIDTVAEYRKRKVPLDLIIQDWQYWKEGHWGAKKLDEKRYPDMAAAVSEIHKMGAKVMVSIWPNMSGGSEDQQEFLDNDLMLDDGTVYNAFDPKARDLYWKQADEGLFQYGIDAWWCDSSEPYDAIWQGQTRPALEERMDLSVSEFKKYLDDSLINAYSLMHSWGMYEHQREKDDKKRVVNMTRSAYPGQHRYGTIVWSGDVCANWDVLKKQVHIVQNYISSGEAYWNSDIGAFFVKNKDPWFWKGEYEEGNADPKYRELYTRWFQFAGFTPFLRAHGTDTYREIWQFGEKGSLYYDAIEEAIRLRYSLVPYFYSVHLQVTFEGKMPVKPLALAFPEDKEAHKVFSQYMYGDAFLVCPITDPEKEAMDVYLPTGKWYDLYTEKSYEGGKIITVKTTMQHIPVFVKAGSIVPTVEVMQFTDEILDAEYELRVFAGADGEFVLYDDAGDGYEYEQGEYSRIKICYDDKTGKITEEQLGKDTYAHKRNYRMIR